MTTICYSMWQRMLTQPHCLNFLVGSWLVQITNIFFVLVGPWRSSGILFGSKGIQYIQLYPEIINSPRASTKYQQSGPTLSTNNTVMYDLSGLYTRFTAVYPTRVKITVERTQSKHKFRYLWIWDHSHMIRWLKSNVLKKMLVKSDMTEVYLEDSVSQARQGCLLITRIVVLRLLTSNPNTNSLEFWQ